jgi:putative Mg2+ transporter-C (MgtC) family protein
VQNDGAARVWAIVRDEFADITGVEEATRLLLRLAVAVVLSAALGYERERRGSSAGLRTHMLVGLGCALVVIVPQQAGMQADELSRVLQGLLSGIGFIGAGAVLKLGDEGAVRGLTTAASIWMTAAIGVAAGMGQEVTALLATVLGLLILALTVRIDPR